MNALGPPTPVIPDNAPFSPAQRAWLNGFLAGLYGGGAGQPAGMSVAVAPEEEDFPWHDPALEIDERLQLAAGKPLPRRLMAAMAQLDCGQCGYLCQTYAEALAEGRESSLSLCVPGAKVTARTLKKLLGDAPVVLAPIPPAPAHVGRPVRVVASHRLTGAASQKDVRHVVIETDLQYEPGDSISLATPADPELVAATLAALGTSGEELVPCPDGVERPVRIAMLQHLDIARPFDRTTELLAMAATDTAQANALRRLADGDETIEPQDADLLDLLDVFASARPSLVDLAKSLPALKPRLYSIASSLRATPGQVHLCVSVVRASRRRRVRKGVASAFLAERAVGGAPIFANIHVSPFRLPKSPDVPVIMCGPGTGIAPFRAFLQERAAVGAKGRTWLFFGEQHEASDFLFRDELLGWLADGTLRRLDTAFSRDQAEKLYVQHRMAENAADLWRWIQDGGHFYVCGDAMRMAKDVDTALRLVAMTEGGLDEAQARDWIGALARQGRYQRDIY
jgi:sulfite reductase (NADPH) flavoprotein alpha-component